jgi:hypothetical protein
MSHLGYGLVDMKHIYCYMEANIFLHYDLDCVFFILHCPVPYFYRSGDRLYSHFLNLGCLYLFQDLLNVIQLVPYPQYLVLILLKLFFCTILYPLCDKIDIILIDCVFQDLFVGLGLLAKPTCMYDWPFGIVFDRFSCFFVSPLPYSSCTGALSFFPIYLSLFRVLPFFCCVVF